MIVKKQWNNSENEEYFSDGLLINCMWTTNRLGTIAFLTQPLKTGEFRNELWTESSIFGILCWSYSPKDARFGCHQLWRTCTNRCTKTDLCIFAVSVSFQVLLQWLFVHIFMNWDWISYITCSWTETFLDNQKIFYRVVQIICFHVKFEKW